MPMKQDESSIVPQIGVLLVLSPLAVLTRTLLDIVSEREKAGGFFHNRTLKMMNGLSTVSLNHAL